jgi:hypothetical protein
MVVRLLDPSRNAMVDALTLLVNAGGAGSIQIRSGSQPATAGTAASGTLLATVPLAADAWGDAASGTAALLGTPRTATGAAAGTAGWFRVLSGGGATVFDGAIPGEMTLNSTTISVGVDFQITSLSVTMPSGN